MRRGDCEVSPSKAEVPAPGISMKILPTKAQWKRWKLPSKATYVGVWLAVVALAVTVCSLISGGKTEIAGDYVAGDKSDTIETEGDYVSGDKVSYNTYVTYYADRPHPNDVVSEAFLLNFFHRYSSACWRLLDTVPKETPRDLPGFLKAPYDMNVVLSECHGVAFEYTVPSANPEVTLTRTSAPIEKYFFARYTNRPDFPISSKFIRISKSGIALANFNFVGSKQVFWVVEGADLQVSDIGIRYSEDDALKTIDYLWLFGSNTNDYWRQLDPERLANENTTRLIWMYLSGREAERSYSLNRSSESGGED